MGERHHGDLTQGLVAWLWQGVGSTPRLAEDVTWVAERVGQFTGVHRGPAAIKRLGAELASVVHRAEIGLIAVMRADGFTTHFHSVELTTEEGDGSFEELLVTEIRSGALTRCWQLPTSAEGDRLLRHLL